MVVSVPCVQAADQYLLEPLKELCAKHMTSQLSTENVLDHYELATQFNAVKLEHAALAFLVEHATDLQTEAEAASDSNASTADEGGPGHEERSSYVFLLARLQTALQVCPALCAFILDASAVAVLTAFFSCDSLELHCPP